MSGHGGAGRGQGRKPVLSGMPWLQIGEMCDKLQRNDAEQAAVLLEREKLPKIQRIREAQSRLSALQPGLSARTVAQRAKAKLLAARIIKTDVHPVLNEDGARVIFRVRRRPRQEVINLVSKHCRERLNLKGVTPRRVEAYWKEYRKFLRASRAATS